jgi:hypothetical protein
VQGDSEEPQPVSGEVASALDPAEDGEGLQLALDWGAELEEW